MCFLFRFINFVITRNQVVFASVLVLVGFCSLTSLSTSFYILSEILKEVALGAVAG